MCYPNRSWIIENGKFFHLPNVQSHHALRRFLGVRGEDREVYIPSLLEKKNVKELREKERIFLRDSLRNFNSFVLDNPAFLYDVEFLEVFYGVTLYRNLLGKYFLSKEELLKGNLIYEHWKVGELPAIPTFDNVISLLKISDYYVSKYDTQEIFSDYKNFNIFLRDFLQTFKVKITPHLKEKRVREILHNLEV